METYLDGNALWMKIKDLQELFAEFYSREYSEIYHRECPETLFILSFFKEGKVTDSVIIGEYDLYLNFSIHLDILYNV